MKTEAEIRAELRYWQGVKDAIEATAEPDSRLNQEGERRGVLRRLDDRLCITIWRVAALAWVLNDHSVIASEATDPRKSRA